VIFLSPVIAVSLLIAVARRALMLPCVGRGQQRKSRAFFLL